ncbi:DUF2199 domain-containing protein [Kribbella sp. NPDC051587]|uniref:DUF2199 domain-containing protein n=1 Tax=Kribbella sp. NPDC051587 TaxID=3364119 RepID=UPI00378DE293
MSTDFQCRSCGEQHSGLPSAFHTEAPAYWRPELDGAPGSELGSDQCVIDGEHFFVRGLIELPVIGTADTFVWGVWVSLSQESFQHISDRWFAEGREADPPYFGWLSTELDYSPSTLNLKTNLHSRPVGERPLIELEPTDHPLAVEQRDGITAARAQEIAERLLHPNS